MLDVMIIAVFAGLTSLAGIDGNYASGQPQTSRDPLCHEWHECRAMALAAADRGEYETFHDLAWRAVQTGPPRDAALMYLLARAQALSGRPHDALVMLDRLAEMGAASDAATNDDFVRTRQLPGWPAVAERIEHVRAQPAATVPVPVDVTSTPATARKAPAPASAERAAAPGFEASPIAAISPAGAAEPSEALRFSTSPFTIAGLAYDEVSRRFVLGNRTARKLIVVRDGSNHSVDLVRSDTAGFGDIAALDIDAQRGDLWVASGPTADGAATLHRLQLVSGRPLKSFVITGNGTPVALVDLAVTRSGSVVVLDAAGRILALRPRAPAVELVARIDVEEPISLAVGTDETAAYVAYRDGVVRIDLKSGTGKAAGSPKRVSLAGVRQIRWHRNALIAIVDKEGSSQVVRLELNASGRAVLRAKTITGLETGGPPLMTIVGDDVVYVATNPTSGAEIVAYRVRLR